jgi:hypothetical protein
MGNVDVQILVERDVKSVILTKHKKKKSRTNNYLIIYNQWML